MSDLRWSAIGAGVLTTSAVAVPATIGAQVLDRRGGVGDDTPIVLIALAVVLVAVGAGGFVAARRHPAGTIVNSPVAGLGAFGLVQAIAMVRLVTDDRPIEWAAIPFFALICAAIALVGGLVAQRQGAVG